VRKPDLLIRQARCIARAWVEQNAAEEPGFAGAFFTGSTTELTADAELPAASDVDIVVVLDVHHAPPKLGKLAVDGLVLEVTYAASGDFSDTTAVARDYHLANSFRRDQLIADPTGDLRSLTDAIAATFDAPAQIMARCDNAIARVRAGLAGIDSEASWYQRVMGWMFSTSISTHVVLVAALRNPTVRLRYAAARTVLLEHDRADVYDELLDQLGILNTSSSAVARRLAMLEPIFDDAVTLGRTPFFFSSDISAEARHIAFDGSRALIEDGLHREAIFWIVATYARCMAILAADAPELAKAHDGAFRGAVAELLHVRDTVDLRMRADRTIGYLPTLRSLVSAIAGN